MTGYSYTKPKEISPEVTQNTAENDENLENGEETQDSEKNEKGGSTEKMIEFKAKALEKAKKELPKSP